MRTDDHVVAALERYRLVPIVTLDDPDSYGFLGQGLKDGGLPLVEITLRTPAALAAIRTLAQDATLLVGAGTVVTSDQVDLVAAAGASFIVSPGFDVDVVDRALERELLPIPGIATATELQAGLRSGLDIFKFFPAEALGGAAALRALAAPFPDVRFLPTGGIDQRSLRSYLNLSCVIAVGGSWPVSMELARSQERDRFVRQIAEAARAAHG